MIYIHTSYLGVYLKVFWWILVVFDVLNQNPSDATLASLRKHFNDVIMTSLRWRTAICKQTARYTWFTLVNLIWEYNYATFWWILVALDIRNQNPCDATLASLKKPFYDVTNMADGSLYWNRQLCMIRTRGPYFGVYMRLFDGFL